MKKSDSICGEPPCKKTRHNDNVDSESDDEINALFEDVFQSLENEECQQNPQYKEKEKMAPNVMLRRLALVGDSYVRDLSTCFHGDPSFLRDNRLLVHVFGGGGARLRSIDDTTFREIWIDTIVGWRPDIVLIWLGANDLIQNLRDDSPYNETYFLDIYQLHVELCNDLRSQIAPWGGRLVIMPLIPRTSVQYGMSPLDFFRSVRAFNLRFRRRRGGARARAQTSSSRLHDECFKMNGYHAFREDGSALRDGVHLQWDILRAICQQVRNVYL